MPDLIELRKLKIYKGLIPFLLIFGLALLTFQPSVSSSQKPELELVVQQQVGSAAAAARVMVHSMEDLVAGQLEITYDAELFTVQELSKAALLEQGNIEYSHDQEAGLLKVAWFSLGQISGSGPLFQVIFQGGEEEQPLEAAMQNVELYREDGSTVSLGSKVLKLQIDSFDVQVNGETEQLDAAPFMRGGRTMVPVRFITEQLGASVNWEEATRQVLIDDGSRHIELTLDAAEAVVNGEPETLDAPAEIKGDRTFVPLRFVSETLGAGVTWHEENRSITIALP